MKLEVTTVSYSTLSRIEVKNPTRRVRDIIRQAILVNRIDDIRYQLHSKAGAFLQCDSPEYMLIEFWAKDHQPFVDLLNELIKEEMK